jgi:hypothetical protein
MEGWPYPLTKSASKTAPPRNISEQPLRYPIEITVLLTSQAAMEFQRIERHPTNSVAIGHLKVEAQR